MAIAFMVLDREPDALLTGCCAWTAELSKAWMTPAGCTRHHRREERRVDALRQHAGCGVFMSILFDPAAREALRGADPG